MAFITHSIPNSNGISTFLTNKYEFLVPNEDRINEFEQSLQRVSDAIKRVYPEARIEPYGSYAAGVALKSRSDLDLSVGIRTKDHRATLSIIRETLEKAGFKKVQVRIINAKKIWGLFGMDTVYHVHFDITLNKRDGQLVTSLVRSAAASNVICKQLIVLIKDFVKVQDINGAPNGTLSSLAYCFLCIFYLQKKGILPVFRSAESEEFNDLLQYATNFEAATTEFQPTNNPLISDLLYGFFRYYKFEFDFSVYAVSVNKARLVKKETLGFPHTDGTGKVIASNLIVIPDPFKKKENIARTITPPGLVLIDNAFLAAYKVLRSGQSKKLFNPFIIVKPK